jgi:hypothetical protein
MAENKNTDLTRDQYTKKANEWIKDNPKEWKEIKAKAKAGGPKAFQTLGTILKKIYGQPHWQDAPGRSKVKGSMPTENKPGVDFTIYDRGEGKGVGFKSNPNRKVTRGGGSDGSRSFNEKISTPKQTPGEKLKFGKAMTDASKRGLEGDHDNPVYRTGNALKFMSPARIAQYLKRMHAAGQYTGNDARNITPRTGEVNRGRNKEFNALDRAILNAGKTLKILGGKENNNNGTNGTNGTNGKTTNGRSLKFNGGFGQDFDYKNTNASDRPSETSMPRFNLPGKHMTPDGVIWPFV